MGSEISPLPMEGKEQTGEQPAVPVAENDLPILRTPPIDDEEDRGMSWIFFGEDGLRAGWSLAIFIALVFLLGSGLRYGLKVAHLKLPARTAVCCRPWRASPVRSSALAGQDRSRPRVS